MIGVPLAVALQPVLGGVLIIEVGVIIVAFTFTLVSLFFDVWYSIFTMMKKISILSTILLFD